MVDSNPRQRKGSKAKKEAPPESTSPSSDSEDGQRRDRRVPSADKSISNPQLQRISAEVGAGEESTLTLTPWRAILLALLVALAAWQIHFAHVDTGLVPHVRSGLERLVSWPSAWVNPSSGPVGRPSASLDEGSRTWRQPPSASVLRLSEYQVDFLAYLASLATPAVDSETDLDDLARAPRPFVRPPHVSEADVRAFAAGQRPRERSQDGIGPLEQAFYASLDRIAHGNATSREAFWTRPTTNITRLIEEFAQTPEFAAAAIAQRDRDREDAFLNFVGIEAITRMTPADIDAQLERFEIVERIRLEIAAEGESAYSEFAGASDRDLLVWYEAGLAAEKIDEAAPEDVPAGNATTTTATAATSHVSSRPTFNEEERQLIASIRREIALEGGESVSEFQGADDAQLLQWYRQGEILEEQEAQSMRVGRAEVVDGTTLMPSDVSSEDDMAEGETTETSADDNDATGSTDDVAGVQDSADVTDAADDLDDAQHMTAEALRRIIASENADDEFKDMADDELIEVFREGLAVERQIIATARAKLAAQGRWTSSQLDRLTDEQLLAWHDSGYAGGWPIVPRTHEAVPRAPSLTSRRNGPLAGEAYSGGEFRETAVIDEIHQTDPDSSPVQAATSPRFRDAGEDEELRLMSELRRDIANEGDSALASLSDEQLMAYYAQGKDEEQRLIQDIRAEMASDPTAYAELRNLSDEELLQWYDRGVEEERQLVRQIRLEIAASGQEEQYAQLSDEALIEAYDRGEAFVRREADTVVGSIRAAIAEAGEEPAFDVLSDDDLLEGHARGLTHDQTLIAKLRSESDLVDDDEILHMMAHWTDAELLLQFKARSLTTTRDEASPTGDSGVSSAGEGESADSDAIEDASAEDASAADMAEDSAD
ncbi:hypothetical protein CXG81DRAFT_20735 [Caulochytrium protostelioides]|uniref:Uncharacterized protein n=1 Tax=Caulochytrium protostelioides TaxID=1555241 RepID=A0A4P9WY01_9FUNG|nr:hypothetical protein CAUPRSCDRAFT_10753 [Caulochytrium protostelioides]RKO99142.1 hypothetical protein CXG81DRAFT_20735 [Caulochytrium protostelioides]|eukprot:RKO99142.1 hypothetical protein CXG81DRAFT_20735 [Caulochytrium protostelioides]